MILRSPATTAFGLSQRNNGIRYSESGVSFNYQKASRIERLADEIDINHMPALWRKAAGHPKCENAHLRLLQW